MDCLDYIKDLPEFKYLAIKESKYTFMAENATEEQNNEFIQGCKELNMEKLIKQCALESLKKRLISRFGEMWDKVLDSPEFLERHPILKQAQEATEEKYNTDYLFLTVNPRDGVGINELRLATEKAMKKSWLTKYIYVYEQRSKIDDVAFYGQHMHCLFYRKGKKMNEIKREFASSFRKICDVDNPSVLNIKFCTDDDIKKRLTYILGTKNDPDKQLKQEQDKKWRKEYFLKDYYIGEWDYEKDPLPLS